MIQPRRNPTIAIFASDRGHGDAERASIMGQAGSFFARKGAGLICLVQHGTVSVPVVTSARAAGGSVTIVCDDDFQPPPALGGVPLERVGGDTERLARIAELSDAFVGLPGSLASVSHLFSTWAEMSVHGLGKPVILYNRNKAYEVVRGFAVDVLAHGRRDTDRHLQFAESLDDLWNRLTRMLAGR